MTIDVAFIPPVACKANSNVYVVIDVLRASSTISVLFDKGCRQVMLTDNVDAYIGPARDNGGDLLLCAESVAGYCLEGADFSPSLLDLVGKNSIENKAVLMQTTNGTVAVHTLIDSGSENIFIGSMRNATAAMRQAVQLAHSLGTNLHIVCAGREAGTSYTIDDVYCAAHLVNCAKACANDIGFELKANDSARLALMTHAVYAGAEEAFADSASGAIMRGIDCAEDIALCAMVDVSAAAPRFTGRTAEGHLRFENAAGEQKA